MNEDVIVVGVEEEGNVTVNVEEVFQDIEKTEKIEYIEVEEPEEVVIEMEEGTSTSSNIAGNFAPIEHRHQTDEIDELDDRLDKLASAHDYYSIHGGYAEFREWAKGGYYEKNIRGQQTGEAGYFVSLINSNGNECIEICGTTSTEVYGVIVGNSAFCGYQTEEYNLLDKNIISRGNSDQPYAKVCLLGTVMVRVYSSENFDAINVGDFVIPDEFGCAKKSGNNIGFKVTMKEAAGTGINAWDKVSISLVPQNDNVARVMKKLEETNKGVGDITVQLDTLEKTVNNNISISGDFAVLEEAFGKLEKDVNTKFEIAETTYKTAQEISDEATKSMEKMTTNYNDAMNKVSMDISNINIALDDIGKYDLDIITEYGDSIAGFFSETSDDKVTIGAIAKSLDEANSNLSMIKQSSNAIQHLVCSIDVYSVGYQSPTDGLSFDGANSTLGTYEYIYVPIAKEMGETINIESSPIYICNSALEERWYEFDVDSITYYFQPQGAYDIAKLEFNKTTKQLDIDGKNVNTYNTLEEGKTSIALEFESEKTTYFVQGYSYKWKQYGENNNEFWWVDDSPVSFAEDPPSKDYELWYTRNGIQDENDDYIYNPGTLYRLIDDLWVAVATINDNNARTTSLITQTADSLTSTITNVAEDVSAIRQEVDNINLTVSNHDGQLSEINQTAEDIRLGVYSPGGEMSSLELLLGGLSNNAVYVDDKVVYTILDSMAIAVDGNSYTNPPSWNGSEFVFSEEPSADGTYCFASKSKDRYYHNIDGGYEVYMINSTTIASLNTRVTDTESEVESWTQFESEFSETMTKISQGSTRDVSELIAMTLGNFTHKIKSVINPTEEQLKELLELLRYNDEPSWDKKAEKFLGETQDVNGKYCIAEDGQHYYELTLDSYNNIVGYEKYELKSSNYASLVQKIEDGKSYVGLVAESDEASGSVIARTINDKSEVLIEADKIGISGTAVFSDSLAEGKTTISGNYIKTGVITSNNYKGPVTYRMYGAVIGTDDEGNKIITTSDDLKKCIYYTPIRDGQLTIADGYYYASKIESDVFLFSERQETEDENKSDYIVSDKEFELIPSGVELEGTKFDLNVGTIYSKNLILDKSGNLTITGRIQATSGYIGDNADNGFRIDKNSNGYYYLANNQFSFVGDDGKLGERGIYISREGVGLGNGRMRIASEGVITINDSNNNKLLRINQYGQHTYDEDGYLSSLFDRDGITFYSEEIPCYIVDDNGLETGHYQLETDYDEIYRITSWTTTEDSGEYYFSSIQMFFVIEGGLCGNDIFLNYTQKTLTIDGVVYNIEFTASHLNHNYGTIRSSECISNKYYRFTLTNKVGAGTKLIANCGLRQIIVSGQIIKCYPTRFIDDDDYMVLRPTGKMESCIGRIGDTYWEVNPHLKGLMFGLDEWHDYMGWSVWDSRRNIYGSLFSYHNTDLAEHTYTDIDGKIKTTNYKKGLHVEAPMYLHQSRIYVGETDDIHIGSVWNKDTDKIHAGIGYHYDKAFYMYTYDDSDNSVVNVSFSRRGADDDWRPSTTFYGDVWYGSNKQWEGSDYRLKTNIVNTDINAMELLRNIDIKTYDWINTKKHVTAGVIAQQLEEVIPEAVSTDSSTDLKSVSYTTLIPYLIKAIQELTEIVSPSPQLMSLDIEESTKWTDNMTEAEKQPYVQLSLPPKITMPKQ